MRKREKFSLKGKKIIAAATTVLMSTVVFATFGSYVYNLKNTRDTVQNIAEDDQIGSQIIETKKADFKKLDENQFELNTETKTISFSEDIKPGSVCVSSSPDGPTESDKWQVVEKNETIQLSNLADEEVKNVSVYYMAQTVSSMTNFNANADVYMISSVAEFTSFASKVNAGNSFSGKTIYLMTNITMPSGFTPIGTSAYPFAGTFNGNGYVISGVNMQLASTTEPVGLFGTVSGGTIKNTTIAGTLIKGGGVVGGIVGYLKDGGTIENCINAVPIEGNNDVGGIVGESIGTIKYCQNSATVKNTEHCAGGIVGQSIGNTTVINCKNTGAITSTKSAAGGIMGYGITGVVSITNSTNSGAIYSTTSRAGGISGGADAVTTGSHQITYCKNTGTVGAGGGKAGGIAGDFSNANVQRCINTNTITSAGHYAGGIVGISSTRIDITESLNQGAVNAQGGHVGGIIGDCTASNNDNYMYSKVYFCGNTGAVRGSISVTGDTGEQAVGGVVGYGRILAVKNCYNYANVTGKRYVGGVVGAFSNYNFTESKNYSYVNYCYAKGTISGNPSTSAQGIANWVDFNSMGTHTTNYNLMTNSHSAYRRYKNGDYKEGSSNSVSGIGNYTEYTATDHGLNNGTWILKWQLETTLIQNPFNVIRPVGTVATLETVAYGANLSYQWYVATSENGEGTAISGATNPTYTATVQNTSRWYYCVITGIDKTEAVATTTSARALVGPGETPIVNLNDTNVTASLSQSTYEYDGTAKKPTVTVKNGADTLTNGTDYTVSYTNNINAGTATVTITGKGNYEGTKILTFTITRKKINIPSGTNTTYNGVSQTGLVIGTGYTVGGTTSAIDAGTYTATATPTGNYQWSDGTTTAKNVTWTISKKSVAVAWGTQTSFVYNGSAQAPTASASSGVAGETLNITRTTGTNAASYTSTASISSVTGGRARTANYNLTGNTKAFTITKTNGYANLSATSGTTTYGTATKTFTITSHHGGALSVAQVTNTAATVNLSGTTVTIGSLASLASGTKVTARVTSAATTNYNAASTDYTLTVNKASISPTVNMNGYTYGGTKSTPSVTGNLENGSVTYYYNTSNSNSGGTAWSTVTSSTSLNAGTYYMYAVIGATTNYNGATTPAKAFTISKASGYINFSATSGRVNYGTATKTFTVTSSHGGTLSVAQTTNTGAAVAISGTTVTISSIASLASGTVITVRVTSAASTNYNAVSKDYTLTIDKENISPTVNMNGYVYGGTKSTPSVTGNLGNGSVTYYYNTSNSNSGGTAWNNVTNSTSLNAGTYYMYAVIGATTNYNGATTPAKAFTISKANGYVNLSETSGNISYGTASKSFIVSNHHGGTLSVAQTTSTGATVSISGTTVTINSLGSLAGGTTVTVRVTSSSTTNYNAAYKDYTLTVGKANITPTVNMTGYTYAGTKSTPSVTGNLGNGSVTYYYSTSNSNSGGTAWSTVTSSTSLNAGTYYMYAVIGATTNYNGATTPAKAFTISKANGYINLSETSGTATYGTTTKTFTVTSHHGGTLSAVQTTSTSAAVAISGTTVTISSIASIVSGTTITVRVTSAENVNYNKAYKDYTLTIGKANINPTVNMKNYKYGDAMSVPSVTGNEGNGTETYYYNTTNSNSNGILWSTVTSSTSLNAGTYYMYAVIGETTNYNSAITPTKAFTIESLPIKGNVTIGGVPMVNKTLAAMVAVDPEDCSLSYKWYVSNSQTTSGGTLVHSSTTDNTLVVTESMLDKYIYVEVTASKTNYTTSVFKDVTGIRVREDDGSKDIMEAIRYVIVEDILPILMSEDVSDVYNYGYILGNSNISQRRKDIVTINIKNTIVPTSDSIAAWDASYSGDGSVIAWLTKNANNSSMYDLNIGGKKEVIASSGYYLFAKYPNLTTINGFDIFNTSRVISMQSMFEGSEKLTSLDLRNFNTANVTDMSYMFSECTALNNLSITGWNTRKVTNMQSMFEKCKGFTSLQVSDLNTSSVINMGSMFRDCTGITSINLNSFDTASVTSMEHLFDGCTKLNDVKITINTSNVRDMNNMFNNCTNLITLDLSSFNTNLLLDTSYMFNNCNKLTQIDLSKFNTYNVLTMSGMFKNCSSLTYLDLRTFDTTNLLTMDEMFSDDNKLVSMAIGNNFDKLNGSNAFLNCNSLRAIITTRSISSPDEAFELLDSITMLDGLTNAVLYVPNVESETNYEAAANYDTVFGKDRIRPILELLGKEKIYVRNGENYEDAGVTVAGFTNSEATNYLQYGYKLSTVGIPANTLTNGIYTITYTLSDRDNKIVMVLKRIVYVFDGANLMEREDVNYAIGAKRANKLTYTSDKIKNIYIVDLSTKDAPDKYVDSWDVSSIQNESVMAYVVNNSSDNGKYDLYICGVDKVIAPENSKELFANYINCSTISGFDDFDTTKVKNMSSMFKNDMFVNALDLSKIITSNVTEMSYMFSGMKNAESLDLKSFNTSNVLDMSYMFSDMEALRNLNISTFTTGKVTNMSNMFDGLKVLNALDVSKFDTSNVTNFECMFRNCEAITILDVSKFITAKAESFYAMFENCKKVGTLNVSNFDTTKAKNLACMFASCSAITNLNVSNFKFNSLDSSAYSESTTISGITVPKNGLYGMFMNCEKLAELDLTSWDTSNVTNMAYMFSNCSSITRMNLSNFDTSKVTAAECMAGMFENATKLESVLLGDKFNNLNSSNMFNGCTALKVIIVRSATPATLALDIGLITLNDAILYVPDETAEKTYEAYTNYPQVFGIERIKPILALVGEEVVEVVRTGTYTEKGVSVAGFENADKLKYEWYGYDTNSITVTKEGAIVPKVDTMVVGEYEITYTLKYTDLAGTVSTIDFVKRIVRITETDINSDNIAVSIPAEVRIYNAKEHTPEVTIIETDKETGDKTTLVLGKDYEVSYKNNIEAGTATIIIKGIGPYFGSRSLEFEILKRDVTIKLNDVTKVYDGTPLTSNKFTITSGTLVEGHEVKDVTANGSQTDAGSSDNEIISFVIKDSNEDDVTKNYNVTLEKGTLTVTKAEQEISFDIDVSDKIIIVKGNTYTFSYVYTGKSDVVGSTSKEHIATITKSGNAFTILGVEVGNCKAIITVNESDNFKEKKVEIDVEVIDAYYSVTNNSKTIYYNKLEDAIKENATVNVLKDVKDTSTTVNIDRNINLELGKYVININAPITIENAGILVINASSGSAIKSTSETSITNNGALIIGDSSKPIVNAPRIEGNNFAINGKFTFNDGVLAGSNEPPYTGGAVTIERIYYEIVTEARNGMYESRLRGETNPPEITIIPDIIEKTNKNVTLTVIVTDSQSGVKKVTYTVDGKTYNLDINSNGEGYIIATENNKYLITAEDNFGNVATKEYVVSNIDRNAGNVTNVDVDGDIADNVTVILKNITVDSDDIAEVLFTNSRENITANDENWMKYSEDMEAPHVLDGSTGNGVKTIYAWAKDEAGNISSKPYVLEVVLKTKLIGGTTNMAKFTIAGYDKNFKNSTLDISNITYTAEGIDIKPTEKEIDKITSGYSNGSLVGDKFNLTIKNAKGIGRIIINIARNTLYDEAGNSNDLTVLETDIYIDTAAPVITIESGRIKAKDNEGNLLAVTVNGKLVRKSEGDCGLAVKGDIIKAYDKAGNVTRYTVE